MAIQRSPRSVSIGMTTSGCPGSAVAAIGTESTASCQPGIASAAARPTMSPARIAVIPSAAGFQRRTVPLRSSSRTPSATWARTRAASARCSTSAYSRARSTASAIRPAMSSTSARSSAPYACSRVVRATVIAPSERPRARSGQQITVLGSIPARNPPGSWPLERPPNGGTTCGVPLATTERTVSSGSCAGAQPVDFAVPSEHPVFSLKRRAVLVGARDLVEDAVAIVGMENPRQQLAVPLVGRVAELRLDLRADEPRIVAIADRIDPGHERKAVRQVAVLAVGVGQVLVNSTLRGQAIRLPTIESSRQQARDERDRQRERSRDLEL